MGKTTFLFAGQGAQYPGMGKSLYDTSAAARKVLDEAERLRPGTLQTCFGGEAQMLSQTIHTQPCLMAVDVACAAALMEAGVQPDALAGFSLGELAALPVAGLLPFETAFRLVMRRAELMDACAHAQAGGMLAVLKLEGAQVEALCREAGAYPANYNSPGQVVCAGTQGALAALQEKVKAAGGRALPLAVSGGFHSPLMHAAAVGVLGEAQKLSFSQPALPLYANRSNEPYTPQDAATLLGAQVENPICWTKLIRRMQTDGYTDFIEVGAGKTLTGLMKRIGGARVALHVEDAESLRDTLAQLEGQA